VVDYRAVVAFAARFSPPPVLRLLPGVDHFFNGRLAELREAVMKD
jgi:alpha/beta superfamily hydrolase